MITILACAAPNFQSAKFVFSDTTNSTGWPNDGMAFLLCIVNALYGFVSNLLNSCRINKHFCYFHLYRRML